MRKVAFAATAAALSLGLSVAASAQPKTNMLHQWATGSDAAEAASLLRGRASRFGTVSGSGCTVGVLAMSVPAVSRPPSCWFASRSASRALRLASISATRSEARRRARS